MKDKAGRERGRGIDRVREIRIWRLFGGATKGRTEGLTQGQRVGGIEGRWDGVGVRVCECACVLCVRDRARSSLSVCGAPASRGVRGREGGVKTGTMRGRHTCALCNKVRELARAGACECACVRCMRRRARVRAWVYAGQTPSGVQRRHGDRFGSDVAAQLRRPPRCKDPSFGHDGQPRQKLSCGLDRPSLSESGAGTERKT